MSIHPDRMRMLGNTGGGVMGGPPPPGQGGGPYPPPGSFDGFGGVGAGAGGGDRGSRGGAGGSRGGWGGSGRDDRRGGGGGGDPRDRRDGYGGGRAGRERSHERDRSRERDRDYGRGGGGGRGGSPRRRSSSSSRSASPPRRRKKTTSGWDQPPPGVAPGYPPPPAFIPQQPPSVPGTYPGVPASAAAFIPTPAAVAVVAGNAPVINQATRQARRLYVGNLPPHTTEAMLKVFFDDAMARSDPTHHPGEAVVSVYLNLPKKFGFVEFRTMEEASAAIALDGITFYGCDLKVRRPSDYDPKGFPEPQGVLPLDVTKLGIISTQVPDGPNKVFCGGLPYDLGEKEVKELVSVYGPLKAFHLVREKDAAASKGYCFFEYMNADVTDTAILGLNGIPIGNKVLTVRRAQPKATLVPGGSAALNAAAAVAAASNVMGAGMPMMPAMLMPNMMVPVPTRIVCLTNMVTEEELLDPQEYSEIMEDVQEECKKYGHVLSVVIPRPGVDTVGVGKVFVEYPTPVEADAAFRALSGRQFANRIVIASFLSEEAFAAKHWE